MKVTEILCRWFGHKWTGYSDLFGDSPFTPQWFVCDRCRLRSRLTDEKGQ